MTWFTEMRDGEVFAQDGTKEVPSDAQRRQGLSFLGPRPPKVELHNHLFANSDEKVNYLFSLLQRVHEVHNQGGFTTPREMKPDDPDTLMQVLGMGVRSFGTNGCVGLPGGLILQWGYAVTNGEFGAYVTFPIAFPTGALNVSCTDAATTNGLDASWPISGSVQSRAVAWFRHFNNGNGSPSGGFYWMALGY